MRTFPEADSHSPKMERIARVLKLANWISVWLQLALAAASSLMLTFAIAGRSFSQSLETPNVNPGPNVGITETIQGTTPGIGIGIFWAVTGILALLFAVYLAFRQTRLAKHLRHPDPMRHPKKGDVLRLLRLGVIVGLVGMLFTILGSGATMGILLSKTIAQPQGVAIYDPARIIRSLDVFVAMANVNGIAAHFLGTVTSLSLFNWLHHQ